MREKQQVEPAAVLERRFAPMPLQRSDLDEILRLARSWGLKVRFADHEFEYDSLDEIAAGHEGRVAELSLSFSGDYKNEKRRLRLHFGSTGVLLRCSNQPSLMPLWGELTALLKSRVPAYAAWMRPLEWGVAASPFIAFFAAAPQDSRSPLLHSLEWASLGLAAVFLALSATSLVYRVRTRFLHLGAGLDKDSGLAAATRYLQQSSANLPWRERLSLLVLGLVLGFLGGMLSGRMGLI